MSVSEMGIEIGVWIFPDHANVRQSCQFVARGQISRVFHGQAASVSASHVGDLKKRDMES